MNPMHVSTDAASQAPGQAPQNWISGALVDAWSATSGSVAGAGRVASDLAQGSYSEVVNHPLEAASAVLSAGVTALGVGIAVAGAAEGTAAVIAGGAAVAGSLAVYEGVSLGGTLLTQGPAAVPEKIQQNISDLQTAYTTVSRAAATVFRGDPDDRGLLRADQQLKDAGAAMMPAVVGTLVGGAEGLAVGAVRKAAAAGEEIAGALPGTAANSADFNGAGLASDFSGQALTISDIYSATSSATTQATTAERLATMAAGLPRNNSLAKIAKSALVVPSASVSDSAIIGDDAVVASFAKIGEGAIISNKSNIFGYVTLAKNVTVGEQATIMERTQIGSNSWVGSNNVIESDVKVGDGTHLGSQVWVGREAVIGNGAVIGNSSDIGQGATIGHDVQVGANALVGEHVTIGENSVIADGAKIKAGTIIPPNSTISQ